MIAGELVRAVTTWAQNRIDIVSLAPAGSCARGDTRSDSDVDFVIVCAEAGLLNLSARRRHDHSSSNGVMVLLDRDANLARALRWMLIVQ